MSVDTVKNIALEDPDLHSSSDEYAARFAGTVGRWMLLKQTESLNLLLDEKIVTVLDVGGGHAQIALPLVDAHRTVTVIGSSKVCGERLKDHIDAGLIAFKVGNIIELPYPDESFDSVACFRILSHTVNWRTLIGEMCRVSRQSVIFDYPAWGSVNFLSPIMFHLKKKIEGNTRTFRVFTVSEIKREFKKHGFVSAGRKKQFLFPMALHRALKNLPFSEKLEKLGAALGLTYFFGSPIVEKMVKVEPINKFSSR